MDGQQAHAWLSAARFEPFPAAADGDHTRAVALYDWHAEIAAACFGMVHHFEVILRNAIDGILGDGQPQDPIRDMWLMDFGILQPDGVKQVIVAVERLEQGKAITRGRVVAGVSFGFWAGLFSKSYEELWRHRLRYAFPHGSVMRKTSPSGCDCFSGSAIGLPIMTASCSRTSAAEPMTCCSSRAGSILTLPPGFGNGPAFTRCSTSSSSRTPPRQLLLGRAGRVMMRSMSDLPDPQSQVGSHRTSFVATTLAKAPACGRSLPRHRTRTNAHRASKRLSPGTSRASPPAPSPLRRSTCWLGPTMLGSQRSSRRSISSLRFSKSTPTLEASG